MARILKKLRGYLDFYTSYNETHIGFFTRNYRKKFLHNTYVFTFWTFFCWIQGSSWLSFQILNIVLIEILKVARYVCISRKKFMSAHFAYKIQFSTSNHIINLFLLGRLEDGCLLQILLAKNNCFFLLEFLTPIHYWQLFGISRVFLIFFALPTSSGNVTLKI